jgi:hypothetical protein
MSGWEDEHEDDRPQPRGVHDLGIRERTIVVGAVLACLLLGMLRTAAGIGAERPEVQYLPADTRSAATELGVTR